MSKVSLVPCRGKDRKMTFARLDEEYMADFCLVGRRTLTDFEYDVFRYHFLQGVEWRMCCVRLKVDRGTFFHAVYRIQQKLGRKFRELQPFGLFPVDEYFAGRVDRARKHVIEMPSPPKVQPVQPPVRKIA